MAHDRRREQRPQSAAPIARAVIIISALDVAVCVISPWLIHPVASAIGVIIVLLAVSAVALGALAVAWNRTRARPRRH